MDYREYTIKAGPYKGAKVDVRYLTARDLLVLQQTRQRRVDYLKSLAKDEEIKEGISGFIDPPRLDGLPSEASNDIIRILVHLCIGSKNYRGFDVPDGSAALEAWFDSVHVDADGVPVWFNEVFWAVRDTSVLTEDERKN